MTSALISPEALFDKVMRGDVKVLDASYGLPPTVEGIEGAVDFDIDAIALPHAPKPHTIPTAEQFAEHVSALGICTGDCVVVYDRSGMAMAACRVWWMFRLFGHESVFVLNGGLPAWLGCGFPLGTKNDAPEKGSYRAEFHPSLLAMKADILKHIESPFLTLLDARDARRYAGSVPEPRAGMVGGHIPHSLSLPYTSVIDSASGFLHPPAVLHSLFPSLSQNIVCTCGSGVTACVLALALYETGHKNAAVYDGSWMEWAMDATTPKKTGTEP